MDLNECKKGAKYLQQKQKRKRKRNKKICHEEHLAVEEKEYDWEKNKINLYTSQIVEVMG